MAPSCMNEEEISVALFKAASNDPSLTVLSWQSVDGKGYFAFDVKIRTSDGKRLEPDLVASSFVALYLVEVKALHSEATADERKLVSIRNDLGDDEIADQVRRRTGGLAIPRAIGLVVAFDQDDVPTAGYCEEEVAHLCWCVEQDQIAERGLAEIMKALVGF
jgi:hypothetical protein